jgi:hypothetical protein
MKMLVVHYLHAKIDIGECQFKNYSHLLQEDPGIALHEPTLHL